MILLQSPIAKMLGKKWQLSEKVKSHKKTFFVYLYQFSEESLSPALDYVY